MVGNGINETVTPFMVPLINSTRHWRHSICISNAFSLLLTHVLTYSSKRALSQEKKNGHVLIKTNRKIYIKYIASGIVLNTTFLNDNDNMHNVSNG